VTGGTTLPLSFMFYYFFSSFLLCQSFSGDFYFNIIYWIFGMNL
jgi:hypothetical protein